MKRSSSISMNSTRRKMQETCATLTGEISERLRALSLPNCHLVEAVLKQHSHVFTEDCRDRLKNLLQVIVNVNTTNKNKFDKLDEKLRHGTIKKLEDRIQDMQQKTKTKRNQESQAETEPILSEDTSEGRSRERTFNYGPCSSSMLCNVSSSVTRSDAPDDAPAPPLALFNEEDCDAKKFKTKHPEENNEILTSENSTDKKIFSKDTLYSTYANKTAEVYRFDLFNDVAVAACGDHDSDLEVLFEGLAALNQQQDQPQHQHPREFGDFRTVNEDVTQIFEGEPNEECGVGDFVDKKNPKERLSQIPRSVRARHLSATREEKKPAEERRRRSVPRQDATIGGGTLSPIPEGRGRRRRAKRGGHAKRRVINVPSLAVRAYVALIMDMQRNCALYETFRSNLLKPIELYKEPYVQAAYDCWMDYMVYVKNTLDYLHPYIMNLVHAYYTRDRNDPELREYETRLPKVLVNSMKNIKTWHNALQETIDCCTQLFATEDTRTDVHQLYERYYEKLEGLPEICYPTNTQEEKDLKQKSIHDKF